MSGLSRRPNYEELAQIVSEDPARIRFPDRFALEVLNSFEYGNAVHQGILDLELQQMRVAEKSQRDAALQRMAQNNDVPLSTLHALLGGAGAPAADAGDTVSLASFHTAVETEATTHREAAERDAMADVAAEAAARLHDTGFAATIPPLVQGVPTGAFVQQPHMPLYSVGGSSASSGHTISNMQGRPWRRIPRRGERTEGPMSVEMDVDTMGPVRSEGALAPPTRSEGALGRIRFSRPARMPPPALYDVSGQIVPLHLASDFPVVAVVREEPQPVPIEDPDELAADLQAVMEAPSSKKKKKLAKKPIKKKASEFAKKTYAKYSKKSGVVQGTIVAA